jgi:hypothetical protein
MSAYRNSILEYIERYKAETGNSDGLVNPHDLAAWAYKHGLHKPNLKTVIDAIATDIAQVFREEYRTHKSGLRYRAKHAVTKKFGSKTMSLWGDIDDPAAPHEHFVRSFSERRRGIVGDCLQLQNDVDVYNDHRKPSEPVQTNLNFTYDVEELQLPYKRKAA